VFFETIEVMRTVHSPGGRVRLLVLGGEGMLGHRLCRSLGPRYEVWATYRADSERWRDYGHVPASRALADVDAADFDSIDRVLERVRPDVVVNAVGIVKQRDEAKLAVPSIVINSLLPHRLADACISRGAFLIHMSTDCVFSGRRGSYQEEDVPDPLDLYGRSKLLGELDRPGCITLRTSIIGWEVMGSSSLLEWFAAQRGKHVLGFSRAVFSGLSTIDMADVIALLADASSRPTGLYHVAAEPIDKYRLLLDLREALGWNDITIDEDSSFACDRSLLGDRFARATGWVAPSWTSMLARLSEAWPDYEAWRRQ
jgi:dTDP-4-dehydrorhamnose reductase